MIERLLAIMLAAAPPGATGLETDAEGAARYRSIAEDVEAVVTTEAPAFMGPRAVERTAALVLAISYQESRWDPDVDAGVHRGMGAVCIMQIQPHSRAAAWRFARDRRACLTEGLRLARQSFGACRRRPLLDQLAAYASGSCSRGLVESRARMSTALAWGPRV